MEASNDTVAIESPQAADKEWTQQLLRYRPKLLRQLHELLTTVAAYLPRGLVHHLMEAPAAETFIVPLEGTVMFADIDGFTAMTERFSQAASEGGAEEVSGLVNRFLDILITTTIRYGGDLQKFGGDAGLLLFTGEDHAVRAVAAAIDVQRAMEEQMGEVETSLGRFPFRIAIGLGSGQITSASIGNAEGREWLLAGSPLAAMGQAQGAAPGGGVALDALTRERCQDRIETTPLEEGFYLVERLTGAPKLQALPALPPLPKIDDASCMDWLLQRLNALTPYLAIDLLERLTSASAQLRLWSEHRHVTILMLAFNDFPDLTAFKNQPEALQAAINAPSTSFIRAKAVIEQYDGIVNKIGIGPQGAYLMALFGAPKAHEDDPLRAVLTALEMQETSATPLRVGVNTGFVFAGDVGTDERREYTVMGDAVNLAYRLMSSCPPGEVWLGPDTAQHPMVARRIAGKPGPAQKLKGKRDPIVPFIAKGVRREMQSLTDAAALPFIGRKSEFEGLTAELQALHGGAKSKAVLLIGEAGIGKSRLAYEVGVQAQKLGIRVHRGTAPSYGGHLPYAVWEKPLLSLLTLEAVLPEKRNEVYLNALNQYGLKAWAALLAPIMGLDLPPSPEVAALPLELREKQRQATLRELWIQAAGEQPRLLILENAQWMPTASLELLDGLIAEPLSAPLLILVTCRDEQEFVSRWETTPELQKLSLGPLSRKETVEMARQVVHAPRLPTEVEHWIVKRGSGIPLFTIEAVRALVDSGMLDKHGEAWELTQSLEAAPLPDTTYEVIQSRIDQLEPPSRHLLRATTVVGEQMTVTMVVAGYGEEPRPMVERRLPTLSPLGLVPGDLLGETLIFRQPLVREVAYRGLPYSIRKIIHQRLSEYLDHYREHATSNWLTLLAYHAFEGQDWETAIRANLDLGRRALGNYLMSQATQAFKRVLQAMEASQYHIPDAAFEAHHLLAEALTILGEYDEALEHLDQARQWLPDPPTTPQEISRAAHLEYHTADILKVLGNFEVAFKAVERGLNLPGVEKTVEGASLYLMGAGLFHRQGKYTEEESWASRSARLAQELPGDDARRVLAQDCYLLAYLASRQGNPQRALELGQASLEIYQELQDLRGEMDARNNLLLIHLGLSQWAEAVQHGERALGLAQRIRHNEGQAKVAANLGEIYRYQGQYKKAREAYSMALELTRSLGVSYGEAIMENNLAAIALREGNWEEVRQRLARSEALFQEIGAEEILPELYRHKAQLYLGLRQPKEALHWAQASLQQIETQGARQEAGHSQRVLAEIYLAAGQCKEAEAALEQATILTREAQDPYGVAQVLLTAARIYRQCGDALRAQEALREALTRFEALGAEADIKEVQALLKTWK